MEHSSLPLASSFGLRQALLLHLCKKEHSGQRLATSWQAVALRTNIALIAVSFALFLTFLLLALGELVAGTTVLGGWFGIATALGAWYTALAFLLAEMRSPFSLPVGPRR